MGRAQYGNREWGPDNIKEKRHILCVCAEGSCVCWIVNAGLLYLKVRIILCRCSGYYIYCFFLSFSSLASCHRSPSPHSSKGKVGNLRSTNHLSRLWPPARTAVTRTKWSKEALKEFASRWTRRTRRTRVTTPWATGTPTGNWFKDCVAKAAFRPALHSPVTLWGGGFMWERTCSSERLGTSCRVSPSSPRVNTVFNVRMNPGEITAGDPPEDSLRAGGVVEDVSNTQQMVQKNNKQT